jgi:hypothetical protein
LYNIEKFQEENTMRKLLALFLALLTVIGLVGCTDVGIIGGDDGNTQIYIGDISISLEESEISDETDPKPALLPEDGWYYSAEDVAEYLYTYGTLPENFITKSEARDLGWEGGSVEPYAPGYAIGGDKFGNREGILPKADGRQYYECDIDTEGQTSRGAKRIVFSNDGLIYFTEDHYETFILLYGEE